VRLALDLVEPVEPEGLDELGVDLLAQVQDPLGDEPLVK
jgi:hypothetical protein